MGPRNRINRTRNPLLVAAAAISRSCDPNAPSRITVLRLLGDALHSFQESQLVVDEVKARAAAHTMRHTTTSVPRIQLEADARVRAAHEAGARALFSAVVAALIKLPSRAGPLRRRAVDLLAAAGRAAGPAVVMQAVETVRDHILSLKRLTWSDAERGDFEVVCAIMTLADISDCAIAGRDVAKDSIQFLMIQRVRQKCRRGDLALAIASIIQSFPTHVPPDDRMVDQLLELCFLPSTMKPSSAGVGSALLVALVVPHLVSRGPPSSDQVVTLCSKALRSAPIATERAMWAVALARASVTARRSTTYQLHKYGKSSSGSKFPTASNSFNRLPQRFEKNPEDSNPKVWVSDETFEESLVQVAYATGLSEGRLDSFVAVASVIRMWSEALPESIPVIVRRAFSKLLPSLTLVAAVSALVDGIWLGLLKDLTPSLSPSVFESLIPVFLEQNDLPLSAALHVGSSLLLKFGRQCLRESGLSTKYRLNTVSLIKRVHESLDSSSHFVRMSAVLQNLRIADLSLATKTPSRADLRTFRSLGEVENELSSILGNSAALSVLIEKISSGQCCVPTALIRQCTVDGLALLRPHQAGDVSKLHGVVALCIRRRAGWGLVAALARGKRNCSFAEDNFSELTALWKEELGFAGQRASRYDVLNGAFSPLFCKKGSEDPTESSAPCLDELIALAATRAAALNALACTLRVNRSSELEQTARALVGACAARIIATQTNLGIPTMMNPLGSVTTSDGLQVLELSGDKKNSLLKLARGLSTESVQLMQLLNLVPPRGDTAELCYIIALSLGEEAQRVIGELEGPGVPEFAQATRSVPSSERSLQFESAMTNHQPSLYRAAYENASDNFTGNLNARRGIGKDASRMQTGIASSSDFSWVFSVQGSAILLAEDVLLQSATGIAAIVAEDLSASGSLVESLSSAKLSPCFSAAIALEVSRRLSRSDLAEINRALAVLQVLAKRSLTVTGAVQRTMTFDSKARRLYIPNLRGDSNNFSPADRPGAILQRITSSDGWLRWARTFSDEGLLSKVPFFDFHSRSLGVMYATRSIAAEAHRELGSTGGPTLWIGLMQRVVTLVKESGTGLASQQSILHSNGIAALGALLEVVPEPLGALRGGMEGNRNQQQSDLSIGLDEIAEEAIDLLADTVEKGGPEARVAAALALSNCSYRIAASSDRLLGALLNAWAQDKGEFSPVGQLGRCVNEAELWTWCFSHIWKGMGIRMGDSKVRFFSHDSCGPGGSSPSLVAGAAAVLSSCRLHWWAMSESAYGTVAEMSTELLQWAGTCSRKARAAGLYGMVAIWAARIDSALTHRLSDVDKRSVDCANSFGVLTGERLEFHAVLPVQAFSLKEATKIVSAVGPFLDEILYDALAPSEARSVLDELQCAGTAAVMEILRGAGVRETCVNLARLPEVLFATVEAGSTEAIELLKILVQSDSANRPRYWFGLCRAVCLSGDRLNFGTKKCSWDISLPTKAISVRFAVDAVDCSLASCTCDLRVGLDSAATSIKHNCAYGFLRKIYEFAEELCRRPGFDYAVCGEGCKLLQILSSRISASGTSWNQTDKTLREFRDVWDSSMSLMEKLLADEVPYSVVNTAGLAISELLVAFLRLGRVDFFSSARGKVNAFLDKAASQDVSRKLMYADQGEEVGLFATLALVAEYSKVVTALQASVQTMNSPLFNGVRNIPPTRNLFYAVIGDFVNTLHGAGLQLASSRGGALTAGGVSETHLKAALSAYIAPIVLGAVSCVADSTSLNLKLTEGRWCNENAAGVWMARSEREYDGVVLGCLVWLLKHGHEEPFPAMARLSFKAQCQEAVMRICSADISTSTIFGEILVSYVQWDKIEFLKFVSLVSNNSKVPRATIVLISNLALTVLRDMFQDEFESDFSGKARVISEGLCGLLKLLSTASLMYAKDAQRIAAHILDTIFDVVATAAPKAASLFADVRFQSAICRCLSQCLVELGDSLPAAQLCLSEVKNSFWHGCAEESLPHVKISIAMGATMNGILSEEAGRDFVQLLLTPVVLDADEELSIPALCAVLDCHGVEKVLVKILRNLTPRSGALNSDNMFSFVYQLGLIGLSDWNFSVPAALRSSISAIGVDGPDCEVINRIGLVLFSIFVSKLVQELPTAEAEKGSDLKLNDSGRFLIDLANRDTQTLASIVSALSKDERERVMKFMRAFESGGQPL